MAQTKEGALKANAKKLGISITDYLFLVNSGNKRCTKCKTWKPTTMFGVDATRSDGLCSRCISCSRVAVRINTKGRTSPFKGQKHSDAAKAAMSAARVGKYGSASNRFGKPHTDETRAKIAKITRQRTARGPNHYAYSHGKHQRNLSDRRTVEYRQWRDGVYRRDKYTCQQCGDNKGGNLQAHHIKSFADHPDLRYEVSNGLTLCQDCHERLHLKPIPMHKCRRKKHPMPT